MHADYSAHDIPYRRKRAGGLPGWNSAEQNTECIATLESLLTKVELPRDARVCEVGCGAGNLTEVMHDRGWQVTGVDVSQVAIDWAHDRCAGRDIQFVCGDVCESSLFSTGAFDLIVDGLCLHCIIGADRPKVISNLHDWLRPGGKVIVYTMCGEPKGAIRQEYDPMSRCTVSGGIATRYFAEPEQILEEFKRAGFHCDWDDVTTPTDSQSTLLGIFSKSGGL